MGMTFMNGVKITDCTLSLKKVLLKMKHCILIIKNNDLKKIETEKKPISV